MPSPLRYAALRLLQAIPVALLIVAGNFVLLKIVPGDLVDVMAGESGAATPEYMALLRGQFGLDQPAIVQFGHYLGRLLQLDLGFSFRNNASVATLIAGRLPATLLLLLTSIGLAVAFGIALGALSARFRHGIFDQLVSVFSSIVFALPVFWVGLMAIVLFAVQLRWLPIGGMTTIGADPRGLLGAAGDLLSHLVLPAVVLGLAHLALYARVTRAAMLEIYDMDFVRVARAKGLSEGRIATRHVLRNALLPVVTLSGVQLGSVLGGAIVVETVFSWPGLGRLAFEAIGARDLNLLLSLFLCNALLVIVMSLVVDFVYAAVDPRIELAR
jgi:peptide/nickel transport system permease protein